MTQTFFNDECMQGLDKRTGLFMRVRLKGEKKRKEEGGREVYNRPPPSDRNSTGFPALTHVRECKLPSTWLGGIFSRRFSQGKIKNKSGKDRILGRRLVDFADFHRYYGKTSKDTHESFVATALHIYKF